MTYENTSTGFTNIDAAQHITIFKIHISRRYRFENNVFSTGCEDMMWRILRARSARFLIFYPTSVRRSRMKYVCKKPVLIRPCLVFIITCQSIVSHFHNGFFPFCGFRVGHIAFLCMLLSIETKLKNQGHFDLPLPLLIPAHRQNERGSSPRVRPPSA